METPEKPPSKKAIIPNNSSRQERRSQTRAESVLSRIEDATYALLRKHDKSA